MSENIISNCPQCGAETILESNAEVNEIITCSDCQADLEIKEIGSNSAVLELAPQEDEDWGE